MLRLLLVEDLKLDGEVFSRLYNMCRSLFHGEAMIEIADTLGAARVSAVTFPPDVIVLDLNLPDSGVGMEFSMKFIEELAASPDSPPVFVLTGMDDTKELRRRCIMAGADDFMSKKEAHRRPEILVERIYITHLRHIRSHGRT